MSVEPRRRDSLVRNVGGEGGVSDPNRKAFAAWDDVIELATEEDRTDFACKTLQWHLLFYVIVLPYFFLQSHITDRMQVYQSTRKRLTRSFAYVGTVQTPVKVSTPWNDYKNFTYELPVFWLRGSSVAGAPPNFPSVDERATIFTSLTYNEIDNPDKFWNWFQHIVGQDIFFEQMCSSMQDLNGPTDEYWTFGDPVLLAQLQETYNKSCTVKRFTKQYLLQGARVRQVMVASESCSIMDLPSALLGLKCYPPLTANNVRRTEPWGFLTSFLPERTLEEPTMSSRPTAAPILSPTENGTSVEGGRRLEQGGRSSSSNSGFTPAPDRGTTREDGVSPWWWGLSDAFAQIAANTTLIPYGVYVYFWQQSETLETVPTPGLGTTYPADGFALNFPIESSTYYGLVNRINQYRTGIVQRTSQGVPDFNALKPVTPPIFFQAATRAVITSMTFYNPNVNLYTYVECLVSISSNGGWVPSLNIFTAPAPNKLPLTQVETTEYVFAILTTIYLLISALLFIKNANIYRLWHWGAILDLVQLGLYAYTVYWIFVVNFLDAPFGYDYTLFPAAEGYKDMVMDPLWICDHEDGFYPCGGQPPLYEGVSMYVKAYTSTQIIFATIALIAFAKLGNLLAAVGAIGLFGKAMYAARSNLTYFAIIVIVIMMGYVLSAYLFWGNELHVFGSWTEAMFQVELLFLRTNVRFGTLSTTNFTAFLVAGFFILSFYFVFLWIFAGVLLAEFYSSWNKVHKVAIAEQRKEERERREQLRIATLFALNPEVDRSLLASGKRGLYRRTCAKMFKNASYRGTGCGILLEHACYCTRPKWIGRQQIRINLLSWKRQPKNRGKEFFDSKLLREALGGGKTTVKMEQVRYYMEALESKLYSKVEMENIMSNVGMKRKQTNVVTDADKANKLAGPTLSVRKSVVSMSQDIANDHHLWLKQIDRYLASLRVRQARASKDFISLDEQIRNIIDYQR